MLRLLSLAAAVAGVAAQGFICPTYVRASVAHNPGSGAMPAHDVWINDVKQSGDWAGVAFRGITPYTSIKGGFTKIGIKAAGAGAADPYVAVTNFTATSNAFYTVGFTGALRGPEGQIDSRLPPFVNLDVRRVPNPQRSTGLWYRWSETPATIDFRAVDGTPSATGCSAACNNYLADPPGNGCPSCGITQAPDVERISNLLAKTVIPLSEIEEGTHSFYPVLMGKTDPLWNARFNGGAGGVVGVQGLAVQGTTHTATGAKGWLYDFFAQGDSLLNANANNLEVRSTSTQVEYDRTNGCTFVLDGSGNRVGTVTAFGTNGAAGAQASVAVALFAAVGTLLAAAQNM